MGGDGYDARMSDTSPGTFLVFDGIDGAGKTTQVAIFAENLTRHGAEVVTSKEPTDGPWGQKIRASAQTGRMSLDDELEAFIQDRREHVREVIEPALARGATVILDRYLYSTIAYQGSRGGDVEAVREAMAEFPEPDLAVILDVDPELGRSRVSARDGAPNHFEDHEQLAKARAIFQSLEGPNIVHVDGSASIEDVTQAIFRRLVHVMTSA